MHTVRKTNEQIIWEERHLLRQLKFFAKSHNESKKCIITAIDQWTLSRIHRQLEGPANPKGAYHYPPWSGDSNSTIRVVQKSLVFANTLANLKMATLNYIFLDKHRLALIRALTVLDWLEHLAAINYKGILQILRKRLIIKAYFWWYLSHGFLFLLS